MNGRLYKTPASILLMTLTIFNYHFIIKVIIFCSQFVFSSVFWAHLRRNNFNKIQYTITHNNIYKVFVVVNLTWINSKECVSASASHFNGFEDQHVYHPFINLLSFKFTICYYYCACMYSKQIHVYCWWENECETSFGG